MWPFKRLSTTRANTPSSTRSSRPSGGYALTRCARSLFPLLNHLRVTVIASLVWGSGGGHIAFTPTRVAKIYQESTGGIAREEVFDKEGRDGRYLPNSRRMANGLAYASDETKQLQVYVQTFPTPGRKWPASTNGRNRPG